MVVYFKDWADIESHYDERFDLTGLTSAEQELKDAVASGEAFVPDGSDSEKIAKCLPPKPENWSKPDPTRHIRADVLRFVLLQQVEHGEMTEAGTRLLGAQITGALDLSHATIPTYCGLQACQFESRIDANGSVFKSNAAFGHSNLPALTAMGATIEGGLNCTGAFFSKSEGITVDLQGSVVGDGVFLGEVTAKSTICIVGAKIIGPLVCIDANFESTEGMALNLQRTEFGASVFFQRASALGSIDMKNATIKGQLIFEETSFNCNEGPALNLQGAVLEAEFFFRRVKAVTGDITLGSTFSKNLVDDSASWAKVDNLTLDDFRYESIGGNTKPTLSERMDWLEKGSVWEGEFFPQPYSQLADTYKRAGHDREARDVRVALAEKLNEHVRKNLTITPNGDISLGFKSAACDIWIGILLCWHKLQLWLTGHGFKPQRALYALVFLVATCWWFTQKAWHAGDFAPNSDVILLSDDWGKYADAPNQAKAWAASQAGKDWESFSPLAYAADIVIPIVDFGQTQAWAPSTNREWWGKKLWWMRWVFTAAGWIISALGAAAITGVIRRE